MKRNMLRKITSICLYIFLYLFNVFPLFILTGCNQLYDLTDAYIPLESSTFSSMQELVNYSIKLGYVPSYSTNGGEYGLISMGDQTGCVVMRSGKVKCWGSNGNGQLGIGDIVNRETPTLSSALSLSDVTTGNDFSVSISAAALHSCGYFKTGFKCWGDQTNGKLGNGLTTAANVLSPVLVSTLGGKAVKKFNVGDFHSCALFTDGVLKCWGANTNGQLGDGTNTTNVNGVTPNAGGAVTEFSCADNSSCAINSNKELRCWGGVITSTSSPSLIASNAVFIGSSDSDAGNPDFFCYINTNQNALCFGVNAFG
ncbi:RCC1 domain-containing protein [Silvanigrella sp.]|uniref:RCC1 domain-containing protein n=1 Tax=Silvanigrella sp. TaxID=2024976 RepID=UPI0037CA0D52